MGGAIVRDLAATHRVIVLGRDRSALARLAADVGAETRVVDLADPSGIETAVADLDRLDVLVHAAAIVAPALLTRAALPLLRESQGTIVFIGSGAGTRPVPGNAIYTASKHALRAIADVLRIDEEPHRIRVVTIAPGQTDTGMLRAMVSEAGGAYEPERYIQVDSIARAVRHVVDAPADVQITDVAVRPRVELRRL
jgi:NADP-dependent 3-hydroxy acid dehydrogenase YdfG